MTMLRVATLYRGRQISAGCLSHHGSRACKKGVFLKAAVVLLLVAMSPAYIWATSADIDVGEIIFACRQPGAGGHWYEMHSLP